MPKLDHMMRSILIAAALLGLSACGDKKEEAKAPPPPPAPLTVGGNVTGLAGGEVVLQLNGADDLTIKADGKFKFPKAQKKGTAYTVTVKTQPAQPVKQTCSIDKASGNVAAPINNVAVTCVTNKYAIGGSVKGLAAKSKGLVLELKGVKEVEITKNGNFVFPDVRLPDGGDFSVAIKSTPAGQSCQIEAASSAPDSDTINIVAVTCKKGRK